MKKYLLSLLLLFIGISRCYSATYYIPDDYANLQAAFAGMSGGAGFPNIIINTIIN